MRFDFSKVQIGVNFFSLYFATYIEWSRMKNKSNVGVNCFRIFKVS